MHALLSHPLTLISAFQWASVSTFVALQQLLLHHLMIESTLQVLDELLISSHEKKEVVSKDSCPCTNLIF